MRRLFSGPFGFVLYHLFFAAAILAVSILGLTLVKYVFWALGGVIIVIGILSGIIGIEFITGIYDKYGNEYYATNFQYKLLLGFSIVIIGAAVAGIPEYFDTPELLAAIFTVLLAWLVGIKMMCENINWEGCKLSNTTRMFGKIVPILYIISAGFYMVSLAYGLPPIFLIIVASICTITHIVRAVMVLRDNPF